MSRIPIILLAAGQSSRMRGTDKLLQQVDGVPLLRHAAQIALGAGPVIVALPPEPHDRYAALDDLGVQKVPVPDAAEGMNASLRTAMQHLPQDAPAVIVLLADLPELTTNDIKKIMYSVEKERDFNIHRGATQDGKPGHPVAFDRSLFEELRGLSGDEGAQTVVRRHKDAVKLIPLAGNRARLDLDTPEAWADWRANKQT
ncbi:molybdopterin-guanine dinucleotide biosynthesis protein A [Falsiruegeria litorea R37]|uniref:Molybdopterin-guanine dinucleotide biosynthesis protein A n=1 Tax=Falsiruegeria litorea R37 TaxID=1200284 RepID=A0A1Y5SBR2_9RHOB|nr:nucleotidyltransferase family protein [Falsiruegeria litorea]SLN36979.1 molybdopterin-guanine dinucleotide biosynthesis protein A [Falsiruegeria litorea R37]